MSEYIAQLRQCVHRDSLCFWTIVKTARLINQWPDYVKRHRIVEAHNAKKMCLIRKVHGIGKTMLCLRKVNSENSGGRRIKTRIKMKVILQTPNL